MSKFLCFLFGHVYLNTLIKPDGRFEKCVACGKIGKKLNDAYRDK